MQLKHWPLAIKGLNGLLLVSINPRLLFMKEESLFDLNKSKEVTVEKKKSRFFIRKKC